uniref:Uncharacterized protein n=1 Tax=Ixodes ricinus TaxID=34613 RepID=A0A6B0UJQ0_IXORI
MALPTHSRTLALASFNATPPPTLTAAAFDFRCRFLDARSFFCCRHKFADETCTFNLQSQNQKVFISLRSGGEAERKATQCCLTSLCPPPPPTAAEKILTLVHPFSSATIQ